MKRTLIVIALILAAGGAVAADLFPAVTVSAAQQAKFYLAYADLTGYYELDQDGNRITDKAQWTNTAAIAAHVRAQLIQMAKDAYKASERRAQQAALPEPDSLVP